MKIYIKIFLSSLLAFVFPVFALAAFNDVSLVNGSAIISISSVNLTVQGGNGASVETIVVNSDTFVPTMPGNSYFKVKSTDRRKFTIDPVGSLKITTTCSDTESTLELDNPASGPSVSPSIGVSSDSCAAGGGGGGSGGGSSSSGGGSSGGGGGGGGGPSVIAAAPKYVPVAPPVVAQPSPVAVIVSPVFNSNLLVGSKSDDVKKLQQFLNSDPDTRIVSSGAGSLGNETTFFGSLTAKAVGKFQLKYGVVSKSSDSGYGRLGPKTRAKLQEVFGGKSVAPKVSVPIPVPPPPASVPTAPVNPVQPVVPPATTKVAPPPSSDAVPFWMQLKSVPRAGGASTVDPSSPSSPESPKTLEEKKAYSETLPFWMRLTQ